jgi:redox-sensitive bicupin YhaK (pirin superfamily)
VQYALTSKVFNMKRSFKAIYNAAYEPIADLVTYRAMPTNEVPMNLLDPFIFLNHHGWQRYKPHNRGLPFGPHPHRGFETITFIIEGDLMHKDNGGGESIIKEGGVQWMTAGKGLVHAEISSDEFKQKGGPLEILQLWVNLPAKYKMTKPAYTGLQKQDIPVVYLDNKQKVKAFAISGNWNGTAGAYQPLTGIAIARIDMQTGSSATFNIEKEKNIFLYVVRGEIKANDEVLQPHQLPYFDHDGEELDLTATKDSIVLLGHATPFNEPFVAYGPFVMNTQQEIVQAYEDYNNGLI